MSLQIKVKTCDRCGTCIAVCPVDALEITENLTVNREKCIECGTCVAICPLAALTIEKK